MTGVNNEQACKSVDVALAFIVPDVVAIAFDDEGNIDTAGDGSLTCEVHPKVIPGLVLQGLGFSCPLRSLGLSGLQLLL